MSAVVDVDSARPVIRHKVEKIATRSDQDAYTMAAVAAGHHVNTEKKSVPVSPSQTTNDHIGRIDEAFAKLKIVMQTQEKNAPNEISAAKGPGAKKTASEQFMDYMHMTPREKILAGMLAELGITKEEYDAMNPEEKDKVNKKIEELEKKEAQYKTVEASEKKSTLNILHTAESQEDKTKTSGRECKQNDKEPEDLLV